MEQSATAATIRLDKWLWQARFFKSRSLSAGVVEQGGVRVNGQRVAKPAYTVRPGDVLTFAQGARIRVVRVRAPGDRRGPAPEAQELYDDLDPGFSAPQPLE
ncbi:MAG: RNA-binding S4 domain-containing protein [Gemmobacter sp.]|nr:RNA-binding S4 domain-containing protein [Gemmobacter sp.]